MSVIDTMPFIKSVLGSCTINELKSLSNYIDGINSDNTKFRTLYPNQTKTLSASDKITDAAQELTLELNGIITQKLYHGYLIYNNSYCVLIAYASKEAQLLTVIELTLGTDNRWSYLIHNGPALSITDLRSELNDVLTKKSDSPDTIVVSDITHMSDEQIDSLKAGDVVQKKTGNQLHTYIVTYKENDHGICLSYFDAGYLETVSYDYTEGHWVYNSTDVVSGLEKAVKLYTAEHDITNLSATEIKAIVDGEYKVIHFAGDENICGYVLQSYVSIAGKYYLDLIADEGTGLKKESYVVDGTSVETNDSPLVTKEELKELFLNVDSQVFVSTDKGVTWSDPITPLTWYTGIHEKIYAVGTLFKITKVFNGKTMRFIAIGISHDVLSNTDVGELEPNGDKADITLQCYDMPFGRVNLCLPYEEAKEGHLRTSEDSGTQIEDCRQFIIASTYPSNSHGYASAVGLRQAEQAFYDGLAPWLQALIKVVRKDIFIPEIDDGDNYEMFDSTASLIAMEGDRYGSQVDCKVFSLSAAEVGIIPNPNDDPQDHFPYSIPYDDGEEVKNIKLEGHKYAYFNETYAYTNEDSNDKRRPRYWNNELWFYWLRSPGLDYSYNWGGVYDGGGVNRGSTDYSAGVAPAFCI